MLQKFVSMLIEAGFSIIGSPAVFSVNYGERKGSIEAAIQTDGRVQIQVEGAPHQEAFAGKDLMDLCAEMESFGEHSVVPVSGNQYRVNDSAGNLAGEFLIAPEKGGARIVLQACSASSEYRKLCEEAGVPVKDFTPDEVKECLRSDNLEHFMNTPKSECCW